jgi:cytochrome c553
MKTVRLALAALMLANLASPAVANSDARLVDGKRIAETVCMACHGLDGQGAPTPVTPSPPRLGAQQRNYLAGKLEKYRSGDLDHPVMSAIASGLSDDDIVNVAEWYSRILIDSPWFTQEAAMGMVDDSGDPSMTPQRWAGKLKASQVCANCHGLYGQALVAGNSDLVPNLTAQNPEFIIERLHDYRSGKRQSNQMSFISKMLSDVDIENLARWYSEIEIDVADPLQELAPASD